MKVQKNALEWTVFAVSSAVFGALLIFLAREAVRAELPQPRIEIAVGAAERQDAMWAVPVRVSNSGSQTAQEVRIEVVLQSNGRDVATAEVNLPFVPRGSEREAWALFDRDPAGHSIVTRVVSFKRP